VLSLDAPNQLIGEYPLVLVPVFGVPLAAILHVASLIKLSRSPTGAQASVTKK
jgi:hypothetical protein